MIIRTENSDYGNRFMDNGALRPCTGQADLGMTLGSCQCVTLLKTVPVDGKARATSRSPNGLLSAAFARLSNQILRNRFDISDCNWCSGSESHRDMLLRGKDTMIYKDNGFPL